MALIPKTRKKRTYKPTEAELAAIRTGEAEFAKGDLLTLAQFLNEMRLLRHNEKGLAADERR